MEYESYFGLYTYNSNRVKGWIKRNFKQHEEFLIVYTYTFTIVSTST